MGDPLAAGAPLRDRLEELKGPKRRDQAAGAAKPRKDDLGRELALLGLPEALMEPIDNEVPSPRGLSVEDATGPPRKRAPWLATRPAVPPDKRGGLA